MNNIHYMDAFREKVYLAALLHDIVKLYQRVDTGSICLMAPMC